MNSTPQKCIITLYLLKYKYKFNIFVELDSQLLITIFRNSQILSHKLL